EPDAAGDDDPATWRRHFAVNLEAPVALSRAFAAQAPDGGGASIVNLLDQKVLRLDPTHFSYTLSKAALWTATQTMAQAFAPRVRVNAIAPGPSLPNARQTEEDFARESARTPLRRPSDPGEVARAALYLARAAAVTGTLMPVDSGQHLDWPDGPWRHGLANS
ncbi:MAG: SDR family oxidoreductase, partial [Hyphomicrobiales bacterium]|nr:SDR family oxidoreductase [Hyphomicrobiales bacterium]